MRATRSRSVQIYALLRERRQTEALEAEEQLLSLLRTAFALELPTEMPSARTRRLIRRTKEFLESAFQRSLRLSDVAGAVGASSTYLTDVFSRFEGVSLHRYVTQLRLARALVELPESGDLTRLALDLGFSSHSHFTLAFRRAFGCTPSTFRARSNRTRDGVMLAAPRSVRGDRRLALVAAC
jgi:AraC family transcriptional regulator